IVAFYASLHLVDRLAARINFRPGNHGDRLSFVEAWQRLTYRRYAKLELAIDTTNHVILAAFAGYGPRPDADRYVPLLQATRRQVKVKATVADAGYDSEPNHKYARQQCGVLSFMPATIGRPTTK